MISDFCCNKNDLYDITFEYKSYISFTTKRHSFDKIIGLINSVLRHAVKTKKDVNRKHVLNGNILGLELIIKLIIA